MDEATSYFVKGYKIKRQTKKELKKMKADALVATVLSYIANYDRLRGFYADRCIEVEYLKRRVEQLEKRILVLNPSGRHHSFTHVDKKIRKLEEK